MEIRVVDAGRALNWFQDGFALFRQEPLVWIVQVVIFIAVFMVLSMVPLAGQFVATLLSAVFAGGFLWNCEQGRKGQPLKIDYLFEGFRQNTSPLLIVGAVYALGTMIAGAISAVLVLGAGAGLGMAASGMGDDGAMAMMGMGVAAMLGPIVVLLVALLLSLPLAMAFWFAPALVLFDGIAPLEAMKLSFVACCKNWLALLVYGVVFTVLALLASIPFGLGWLVLLPTMMASTYAAYREMFQANRPAA